MVNYVEDGDVHDGHEEGGDVHDVYMYEGDVFGGDVCLCIDSDGKIYLGWSSSSQ